MKLAKKSKTKVGFSLVLVIMVLGTLIAPLLPSPKVAAAPSTFIDGNGATSPLSVGDNTRFKFIDPFRIEDTQAKDSSGNNIIYSTASTACGSDNLYLCSNTGTPLISGSYWYWPNGNVAAKASNNACVSGMVLQIRKFTDDLSYARLSVVNAHVQQNNGGCYIAEKFSGKMTPTADITGWGAPAVDDTSTHEHATMTLVEKNDVIELDHLSNADKTMFYGLGVEFGWAGPNEIDSYVNGKQLNKITDPTTIQGISNGLSSGKSTSGYAKNYDYYINNECLNSANQYLALVAVKQGDPSTGVIVHRIDGGGGNDYAADAWQGDQQKCLVGNVDHTDSPSRVYYEHSTVILGIGDVANFTKPGSVGGNGGGGTLGGGSDADAPQFNCSINGYNPLTWLLCPIATMLVDLSTTFDNAVTSMLCINPDTSDSSLGLSSCSAEPLKGKDGVGANTIAAYKTAWATMRDISLGIVVIIGLIAIFSQASGLQVFDAYTIKKTMPRLLVAAVAVSLSWPLMNWFIQFTNDLGFGVRVLIYKPFQGSLVSLGQGTSLIATVFGVGGFVALLGIPGLISFAGTAALFGAVAFLILTIRQMAIIALVIAGPLFIMLYAAPYGQKLAARWWKEFLQLTIAFPMITAAIALGHVFGAIGTTGNGAISQLLGLTAYFAGEVATVGILLKRGEILGAAGGLINKQAQKGYSALSKRRGARASDRLKRARAGGNIWQKNSGMVGFSKDSKFANSRFGQKVVPRGMLGKQFSIGNAANTVFEKALDGEELAGSFLGTKLKVPGFKGYARKAEAKIAHERSHQIAKFGSETFGSLQHQTKSLMTGDYSGLKDANGNTDEALLNKIGNSLGRDKKGNINAADSAQRQLKLAEILKTHDKVKYRSGADDLTTAAGFSEAVNSGENHRANGHLKLAAAVSLAQEGRLTGENMTRLLNEYHGTTLGHEMHGMFAQLSQKRPDLRIGHGVMEGEDGHLAYVFDEKQWADEGYGATIKQAAYENALSMDTGQIGQAKGAMFEEDGFKKISEDILSGKYLNGSLDDADYTKRSAETEQYKQKLFAAAGPYGHNATDAQAAIVRMFDPETFSQYQTYSGRAAAQGGEAEASGTPKPGDPTLPGMEGLGKGPV